MERLLLRITPAELGIDRQTLQHAVDTRLNHQQKLRQFQGPVLVLHTRHDGLVDVSHAQRLYDWAAEPKQLKIFAQGNHNDILLVNAREYLNLVAEFIAALKSE
ncbi:MAG: alpha/beta hydrolase [Desulfuromonas sp.]|nr:alpha/beta hydrolase [Desulfuromonas sp.]